MSFRLVLEIAPPRVADLTKVVRQVELFRGLVDAILVPDNSLGAAAMSSIVLGLEVRRMGLPPEDAVEALRRAGAAGLDPAGLHVHIGSQLLDTHAARMTLEWLAAFAAACRTELGGWEPAVVDLGGGLGVRHVEDEEPPAVEEFVGELLQRLERAWELHGLRSPLVVFEPGRSLVGRAGVALYRVGVVKRASETTTFVAVDGGMSDNPRPQLYGARSHAR